MLLIGATIVQAPALQVIEPTDGSTVRGSEITVRLQVEGVVLGGRTRNGAYALLTLDEMPPVKSYSPRFTFRGVPPGEHRLRVELRRAEGGEFDPPVLSEIQFTVATPTGDRLGFR
jgi:hypothetical protein